jgi:hypothetical protein
MTSPSLPIGARTGRLTYARSRLYLGITGVGTAVLAAMCLLAFDIPSRGFSTSAEQSLSRAMLSLGLYFALLMLGFFLFDLVGGAWVVRRKDWAQLWLSRWLRGVAVQWTVWMTMALALMLTARAADTAAVIAVFALGQVVLAALRGRMVRVIARMPVHPTPPSIAQAAQAAGLDPAKITVVDTPDEGFVGGWSGIVPDALLVPRRWSTLPADALTAQLARRKAVAVSGAHRRGVLGAIVWNTAGFAAVLALTGATPATAAGIVTLAAGMTLWAFLGVLVLPTPSRAAVYAADAAAARQVGLAGVRASIELLDKWQDDEPTRSVNVERIFHPVPARTNRLARLAGAPGQGLAAWHAHHLARHALWLGWGALSPISRLVHCNVGRTALWAMLPGD